jgi:hypothetical protein
VLFEQGLRDLQDVKQRAGFLGRKMNHALHVVGGGSFSGALIRELLVNRKRRARGFDALQQLVTRLIHDTIDLLDNRIIAINIIALNFQLDSSHFSPPLFYFSMCGMSSF